MTYEVENLHPKIHEPEGKDAKDGPPPRARFIAGTVASALALGAAPHGLACADINSLASLLCRSAPPMRHDQHIEQTTSTATASFYAVAIVDMSSGAGVTVRPPSAEIGLTTYAPEVRIGSNDPSSGAALGLSVPKSA